MTPEALVCAIQAAQTNPDGWTNTEPIPLERVLAWMQSDDLNVMGALHSLLERNRGGQRIVPPLPFARYRDWTLGYFARCLEETPEEGESRSAAEERYPEAAFGFEAAHNVCYWFYAVWKDHAIPREEKRRLKDWLRETLLRLNPTAQALLATAIFDHLFIYSSLKAFFADWYDDPRLARLL